MKKTDISREDYPDLNELMSKLLSSSQMESILPDLKADDIPDIDLYMDQVTTFMDSHLGGARRNETDKVLTKTMINNYAKNKLLPPPEKKKYSREHLILMLFIYYFKGFLSMQDIRFLLQPLSAQFFGSQKGPDICEIYRTISEAGADNVSYVSHDIEAFTARALDCFKEAGPEDRPMLQYFAMICFLSIDIYLKKRIVEKMIDEVSGLSNDTPSKK